MQIVEEAVQDHDPGHHHGTDHDLDHHAIGQGPGHQEIDIDQDQDLQDVEGLNKNIQM